jgi:alpha-beta hydrolase superfamily lysophospholipase
MTFREILNIDPYNTLVTTEARNFSEELYKVLARLQLMRAPMALINGIVAHDRFTLTQDLHYGALERQVLDVYTPKGAFEAPVIVFVHGGYWHGGDKSEYRFLAESFVQHGFVVVAINYRLAPMTVFPSFVQDAARAVRWACGHIQRFGGDPERVTLVGHSSGAHTVSLLSLDASYLEEVGLTRASIRATVGLSGPYDFMSVFETDFKVRLAMHGMRDAVVHPWNSQRLYDRVREHNGLTELRLYASLDHFMILGVMSKLARFLEPAVLDDLIGFLKQHV